MKDKPLFSSILYILSGLAFALFAGSRFSYPIFTLGDTFAPEPFFIILTIVLYFFKKINFYSGFFKKLLLVSLFFFLLVLYSYTLGYNLSLIFRVARPLFIVIGLPFILLNSSFLSTLNRDSLQKILVFFVSFSFFSFCFGIASVYLQPDNEIMRFYGGLRTLQPSIAPLSVYLGLVFLDRCRGSLKFTSLLFYAILANLMCTTQFFVGLARFTLITLIPINISFLTFIIFDKYSSLNIFSLKINKYIFTLFFIFLCLPLLTPSLFGNIIDGIFTSTASNQYGDVYDKSQLFTSQLSRLTNIYSSESSNSALDIRTASVFYLLIVFYDFILPHGFNIGYSKDTPRNPHIDYSIFDDLNSHFISIKDSGIMYFVYIFGFFLTFILLWRFFKYIRFLFVIPACKKEKSLLISVLLVNSMYILAALYSSDKFFANYSESFHFSFFLILVFSLFPAMLIHNHNSLQFSDS